MHSAQPEGVSEYSRGETAGRYTKKRKSRGRHKVLRNIFIIIAIVLVSGVGAAWAYINNINSRLSAGVDSELRESLTETQSGEPFYMLLLGIDKNEKRVEGSYGADDSAYRSDSIMLARIDPTKKKVTLVSIPRDTYVDMGVNGQEKINAAYSFGGAAYATKVISDFAGVPISHYAEVDMDGMAAVVDAVGGIQDGCQALPRAPCLRQLRRRRFLPRRKPAHGDRRNRQKGARIRPRDHGKHGVRDGQYDQDGHERG